jgi:hypothetical protein
LHLHIPQIASPFHYGVLSASTCARPRFTELATKRVAVKNCRQTRENWNCIFEDLVVYANV